MLTPWKKSYDQPRQHIKKQRHYFANKGPSSQSYGFSSSHLWMWELDHKESWAPKNWCLLTVVLEKTLESLLDCKEIQAVHPKGNQSWIFIGRTDAEAPILWAPNAKNWLLRKDPDAEKDWRQEEKGTIEDAMFGWHHWLHGHEFEQALGIGDGPGSLVCCSAWGREVSEMTEHLNWTETKTLYFSKSPNFTSPISRRGARNGIQAIYFQNLSSKGYFRSSHRINELTRCDWINQAARALMRLGSPRWPLH